MLGCLVSSLGRGTGENRGSDFASPRCSGSAPKRQPRSYRFSGDASRPAQQRFGVTTVGTGVDTQVHCLIVVINLRRLAITNS